MNRKLYLSDTNRKIGGVCGGLGEYLNIDPLIIRLLFFVSIFFGGTGIIAYIAGWFVIPRKSINSAPF